MPVVDTDDDAHQIERRFAGFDGYQLIRPTTYTMVGLVMVLSVVMLLLIWFTPLPLSPWEPPIVFIGAVGLNKCVSKERPLSAVFYGWLAAATSKRKKKPGGGRVRFTIRRGKS
jgi:hypothetical protein